jgi:hypothetical protein
MRSHQLLGTGIQGLNRHHRGGDPGMLLVRPFAAYLRRSAIGEIFNTALGLIGFSFLCQEQNGSLASPLILARVLLK